MRCLPVHPSALSAPPRSVRVPTVGIMFLSRESLKIGAGGKSRVRYLRARRDAALGIKTQAVSQLREAGHAFPTEKAFCFGAASARP